MIDRLNDNTLYLGWYISYLNGGEFIARRGNYLYIRFKAEYNNGLYFKIRSVNYGDRNYTSERYFKRYISAISAISYWLLKNNYLWNYKDNEPALIKYKKDILSYWNECDKLGINKYNEL